MFLRYKKTKILISSGHGPKAKNHALDHRYAERNEELRYNYTGTTTVIDPNVITLDFVVKTNDIGGELNVWGMIDVPLMLKAQYDSRSALSDHPNIQQQINTHLKKVAENINRLL